MTLRKFFFWLHLGAGSIAGAIILTMSVTGVLLMYEKQIIAWADRGGYRAAPPPGVTHLPVETLLAKIRESQPEIPTVFTLRADPAEPAEASFGREKTVFINPYSGAVLGEGSNKVRGFFQQVTGIHRWLGANGEGRAPARAITGACNLAFLFLVASGIYMWWPKKWSWRNLRPVVLFQGGIKGKARDWNWHNVIGIWTAVPLFFVVLTATVMSYPWANRLVYTLTGSEVPAQGGGPGRGPGGPGGPGGPAREGGRRGGARGGEGPTFDGIDKLWSRAEQLSPGWQSIGMRVPASPGAPVVFAIDLGNGGRPDLRSQLSLDRRTGETVQAETFSSYSLGRKLRLWMRWVHTGEAGGWIGQTVAGVASGGGAVLVWTGIALALRRFRGWLTRRRSSARVLVAQ